MFEQESNMYRNELEEIQIIKKLYFEAQDLLDSRGLTYSLEKMLEIDDNFMDFAPHPRRSDVEKRVKEFCISYGIWHKNAGDIYNTMTGYLHPYTKTSKHLEIIGKIYALLYYMDDYLGNEKQKYLTSAEKNESKKLLTRLKKYLSALQSDNSTDNILEETRIEIAIDIIFSELIEEVYQSLSEKRISWFDRFLHYLTDHLSEAIIDHDGMDYSVGDYILHRDNVSGMKPAVLLMEFGSENYLPRNRLQDFGLLPHIEELELLCIRYGGLVNDLFSFHKEVLEDETPFNLVSMMYLNHAEQHDPSEFLRIVRLSTNLLVNIKEEFFELYNEVKQILVLFDSNLTSQILRYIEDLANGMKATWYWQCESGNARYARSASSVLFDEIQDN